MSKFRIQVTLRTHSGISTTSVEVSLPDQFDSKFGNSNFNNEIIAALQTYLPTNIGGTDWRKQGYKVEGFNGPVKIG